MYHFLVLFHSLNLGFNEKLLHKVDLAPSTLMENKAHMVKKSNQKLHIFTFFKMLPLSYFV